MSAELRIVEGGVSDIGGVMAVMGDAFDPAFGEAWTRGQCLGILALPDVWLTLALPGAETAPLGFALARRVVDESELLLLAVRHAARGRGIGRALIEAISGEAARRGAARLTLEMRDGNPALSLYSTIGFREVGRRRNYYLGTGGRLHDALTLARAVDPSS